jgi:hypothetical protein
VAANNKQLASSINHPSYSAPLKPTTAPFLRISDSLPRCIAWFPPSGIVVKPQKFNPDEVTNSSGNTTSSNKKSKIVTVNCTDQWEGYEGLEGVLSPFGFRAYFFRLVKRRILERALKEKADNKAANKPAPTVPPGQKGGELGKLLNCLHRDYIIGSSLKATPDSSSSFDFPQVLRRNFVGLDELERCDGGEGGEEDEGEDDEEKAERLTAAYEERRSQHQEKLKAEGSEPSNYQPSPKTDDLCVQFLNMFGSAAVRLQTPLFPTGPLTQPITIFTVACAQEDGCFVSGVRSRFEVGHLYPTSKIERDTAMSKIAITASTPLEPKRKGDRRGSRKNDSSSDDGDDDDGSTSESSEDDDDESESEDEVLPTEVYRGAMVPGRWHLYTTIFDGTTSSIRIDGVDAEGEPTKGKGCGTGKLDGLTLGSDHYFNMSLCDGNGGEPQTGGGEGEGALAEVVAFKGVMAQDDVLCLEKYLMEKHRLVQGSVDRTTDQSLYRDAHAHIAGGLPARYERRMPLKYAVRERSVAWHRVNPTSGDLCSTSRIGTNRKGSGSSDW